MLSPYTATPSTNVFVTPVYTLLPTPVYIPELLEIQELTVTSFEKMLLKAKYAGKPMAKDEDCAW
jgi:hypothetical protein